MFKRSIYITCRLVGLKKKKISNFKELIATFANDFQQRELDFVHSKISKWALKTKTLKKTSVLGVKMVIKLLKTN